MNGDVGLGGSFARAGCGFFRTGPAGVAEALPPAPPLPLDSPLLLPPNELADLLGGLIAP